jgi:hypothetical protein
MCTVMHHSDNPHEHPGMFSLYAGTKVSEDYTVVLCVDGDVRVLEPSAQRN